MAGLALFGAGICEAAVVRPAPDFGWVGIKGKSTLRSMRGQPVVLVVAKNAKSRAFKKQVKRLRGIYSQFASRGVVFAVAFTEESAPQVPSDIPFAIVNDGPGTAAAYGVEKDFAITVIGKDGNVDYTTYKVLPSYRVRDVIQNSFAVQKVARTNVP